MTDYWVRMYEIGMEMLTSIGRSSERNKGNYKMDSQVKIDQAPNCLTWFVSMLLH